MASAMEPGEDMRDRSTRGWVGLRELGAKILFQPLLLSLSVLDALRLSFLKTLGLLKQGATEVL